MFDIMGMLGKAQEAQKRVEETKARLAATPFVEELDGLRLVMMGDRQLAELSIAPSLLGDAERTSTLVMEAVNSALQAIELTQREELKKATEGLLPNLPGLDLSKLGL